MVNATGRSGKVRKENWPLGQGRCGGGQGTVVQSRAISTRGGERSAWSWLRGDGEEM